MARIAGVDLPRDKRVEIGLTYIYGIGRTSADRILKDAGVNQMCIRDRHKTKCCKSEWRYRTSGRLH